MVMVILLELLDVAEKRAIKAGGAISNNSSRRFENRDSLSHSHSQSRFLVRSSSFPFSSITCLFFFTKYLKIVKRRKETNEKHFTSKAFSYGTFLRTENERFQFSKPIVSLMGSKMDHFWVKFFDFHFRDGLHSEMEPHFRSTS